MPRLDQFLLVLLVTLTLPAQAQISPTQTTPIKPLTQTQEKTLTTRATNIIELANRGQYNQVRQQFSPRLAQGISEADVKNRWEQVTATTGPKFLTN
jgi:hypothetical protein